MNHEDKLLSITPEMVREAQENPKGWVYKIDKASEPQISVPCQSVIGAWKVDSTGCFTGEVILNPKYSPI